MKDEKAKFHITITNNETGEIEVDSDTSAIIGSYHDAEKGPASIVLTHCPVFVTVSTIIGVQEACKRVRENSPMVESLLKIVETLEGSEKAGK